MTKFNIKFFVILMGSIIATGLHGMSPQPQSWAQYVTSFFYRPQKVSEQVSEAFAPQVRRCVGLVREDRYLGNAKALRDMVFDKYKRGTLSSIGGAKHADVGSIDVRLMSPNVSVEKYVLARELAWSKYAACWKSSSQCSDEIYAYRLAMTMEKSAQPIKNKEAAGLATMLDTEKPVIILDSDNLKYQEWGTTFAPLHELAHVFDASLRKPENAHDINCYPWLKEDVKDYDLKKVDLVEWHADKQGTCWLKEDRPDEAKALKKKYKAFIALGIEHPWAPERAPYSKMVEWLSEKKDGLHIKDCLHIKEIKKLGLLW